MTALRLRVSACHAEAKDVLSLELRRPEGGPLPQFEPGAHLELSLPNGLIRHYSLCDGDGAAGRYVVAVGLVQDGRGGSRCVHDSVRVGSELPSSEPRNNFKLMAGAARYRFVAGGIGITPVLAMVRHCVAHSIPWSLLYCARSRQRAAFYETLRQWPQVRFHFDDEASARPDIAQAVAEPAAEEHLYCCGPGPLMRAVQEHSAFWTEGNVHFESFSANDAPLPAGAAVSVQPTTAFTVLLRRSNLTLLVEQSESILEALEARGISVPFSCREGLCRTCETPLFAGEADHRDIVLSNEERKAQTTMMICVSRALTPVLELDL